MSASKLKQITTNATNASTSRQDKSVSAYTAYNAVDELVAKPVFGSDGAKKWQSFSQSSLPKQQQHVAPTAPLKAIDRATGFSSWKEEREYSNQIRQNDTTQTKTALSVGYTNFNQKANHSNEISSKERKRIESRIRRNDQEYFIPSKKFVGWKFDYIYTTRIESYGTGYYFDGMDSLKLLKGELSKDDIPPSARDYASIHNSSLSEPDTTTEIQQQPTTLSIGDNNNNNNDDDDVSDVPKPPKKKKKKIKNQPPVIVNNPNHPLEQIAAILAKRQQQSTSAFVVNKLPTGWEVAKDTITGKNYYYNRITSERTWDDPSSSSPSNTITHAKTETPPQAITTTATSSNGAVTTTTTDGQDSSWNVTIDPTTGNEYYYNVETGETSWEKPAK